MTDITAVFTWVIIFILKLTESDGVELSVAPTDLHETTEAILTCDNIDAPDGAKVTFTHRWEEQIIQTWVESSKDNKSTHALTSLSMQDAGQYDCTVGSETSNKVQLALKAAPRLMSEPYSITYTDIDRTVNLTGKFLHISPIQTYRWSRDGSHISEKNDKTETTTSFRMYGKEINVKESTVWITWSVTSSDFGLYDVIACTNGGCSSAVVEVKFLVPPLPPVEFSVVDNLTDGFWFRWRSDDSAVREQTFQLAYKRADTADDWYSKEIEDNTGPGVLVHSRISGLAVNTGYDVRVRAAYAHDKNKESNYTEELSVFIRGSAPVHELGVGAGVGIGMAIMVVVGALICLAMFLVRRNKRKRRCSSQTDTSCYSDDGYSSKTQMSNMSTRSTNPYQSTSPKEMMPDRPIFPTPASRQSRPALPCSPIPSDRRTVSKVVSQTAAPTPPAPKRTFQKKGSAPRHPPVPLPLPPTDDDVYEPMESNDDDEGGDSGQEYVDPRMTYQNM